MGGPRRINVCPALGRMRSRDIGVSKSKYSSPIGRPSCVHRVSIDVQVTLYVQILALRKRYLGVSPTKHIKPGHVWPRVILDFRSRHVTVEMADSFSISNDIGIEFVLTTGQAVVMVALRRKAHVESWLFFFSYFINLCKLAHRFGEMYRSSNRAMFFIVTRLLISWSIDVSFS